MPATPPQTPKRFVFTLTTGRSGTRYLTQLLAQNISHADIFHERLGFQNLGVHTPDASHFTRFNSVGNVPAVRAFWRQKLERDRRLPQPNYVEISHFLVKAGLLENIDFLTDTGHEVHLIILKRDVFKTLWSYVNRFDFFNTGFTWLFTLDYRYPNVILSSQPFTQYGMVGHALWYIYEMYTRAEYYRLLLAENPLVHLHDVDLAAIGDRATARDLISALNLPLKNPEAPVVLPPPLNQSRQTVFGDEMKALAQRLVTQYPFDPKPLAAEYYQRGFRLSHPPQKQSP